MITNAKRLLLDRWPVALSALIVGMLVGLAGILIIGKTVPPQYWLVFGGNTDPGDGNCGGQARDQFVAGGWTAAGNICQVQWKADITQNTIQETNAAMPAGHEAYQARCRNGCIIAGFSLGNSPALQLAAEVGLAPASTYLFGAPQPSTGVFHRTDVDNPFVEPWFIDMGGLNTDRKTAPGMQAYYDVRDPYANAAPQCEGPGLFALNVGTGHYIVAANAEFHVWTGADGVVMHEASYGGPGALPLSGSDASPPFAGCVGNDWRTGSDTGGGPGLPGGIPSDIPSGIPNLPGAPSMPGLPTP